MRVRPLLRPTCSSLPHCLRLCFFPCQVAQQLTERGLHCGYYHADMPPEARERVHEQWSKGGWHGIAAGWRAAARAGAGPAGWLRLG